MIFINVPKKRWLMTSMASPIAVHTQGIPRSTDQDFQQCGRRRRVPSPLHGTSQSTLSYLPGVHEVEICWVIFSWSPHWYYWFGINIPTRSISSGIPKDLILKRWSLIPSGNLKLSAFRSVWSARIPWDLQVNIFDHPGPTGKCPRQDGAIHGPGMGLWLLLVD
jgi:hypothetical protein